MNGVVKLHQILGKMHRSNLKRFKAFVCARIPGIIFQANEKVKKNASISNLVIEWKRISHPFIENYSFLSAKKSTPCGFVIGLKQAENSNLQKIDCSVFFLKHSSSSVSPSQPLSQDLA